jgi:deoxycytidine triphosphate deaminase
VSVLARDEIGDRLRTKDVERQIFRPGSWDSQSVRGAAYDLRVAVDYLILPDGTRYWPGATDESYRKRIAAFELKPGEVAFVSSAEELCMPWHLTGNIAPKFRLALDGLLVMGGMLVDPGYGRMLKSDGTWGVDESGARLHFQLANLGLKNLEVVPNLSSVAGIQFIHLGGNARKTERDAAEMHGHELQIPSSEKLLRDLFHDHATEPLPQLAFFSNAAEVHQRIKKTEGQIETNQIKLAAAEESTDRLVVFGIFLVAITLIGVIFAALINSLGG